MKPIVKHVMATLVVVLVGLGVGFALFAQSGTYNFAADVPHFAPVASMIENMRDRSVAAHAEKVSVPDLGRPEAVLQGAGNYDAMCSACHLAPGVDASELSRGLYPAPPNLTKEKLAPAEAFWVIKHGIKASGMPAWGKSMEDDVIWNMTAFLQRLPTLDAAQYREMVAQSSGHTHGGGQAHGEAPAMEDHHAKGEGDHHEAEPPGAAASSVPAKPEAKAGKHKDDGHRH